MRGISNLDPHPRLEDKPRPLPVRARLLVVGRSENRKEAQEGAPVLLELEGCYRDETLEWAVARVGVAPVRGGGVIQSVSPRTGIDLASMIRGICQRIGVCSGRSAEHRARHSSQV